MYRADIRYTFLRMRYLPQLMNHLPGIQNGYSSYNKVGLKYPYTFLKEKLRKDISREKRKLPTHLPALNLRNLRICRQMVKTPIYAQEINDFLFRTGVSHAEHTMCGGVSPHITLQCYRLSFLP